MKHQNTESTQIERLTQRAKDLLASFSPKKRVSPKDFVSSIKKSGGVGSHIISLFPNIGVTEKPRLLSIKSLVKEAYYQALRLDSPYVGTEHLLLALMKTCGSPDISNVKMEIIKYSVFPSPVGVLDKTKKYPILENFSSSITAKVARAFNREIVYRSEYENLVSGLLLRESSNVLLVGEPGVGKKSLISLLAQNISSLNVPRSLVGYHVIEFDLLGFMTSVFNKGGFDLGFSVLVEELRAFGRCILYIKNFESLFYATASGITLPMFYSIFVSKMEEMKIRLIATISPSLYEKIFAENEHIFRGFTIVEVKEPSKKEIMKILKTEALALEDFHGVRISDNMLNIVYKKALGLGGSNVKFPKRGIMLLDHACTSMVLKKSKVPARYKKLIDESFDLLFDMDSLVGEGKYAKALEKKARMDKLEKKLVSSEEGLFFSPKPFAMTAMDLDQVSQNLSDKALPKSKPNLRQLSNLSEKIKKRIIGQDEAVESVVKCLIRARMGLRPAHRPLGNMLFLGPTGVGKTELAKVLADVFFGPDSLIRLDMSDFSEKHTVARLIGAPPGYVGYGEGGELTSKIEANPNSVVLFDEIEKAHPDVLNILLQIMEEGELSDAKGQTFDFSNGVVVLTSNLGTEILHKEDIGFEGNVVPDEKVNNRLVSNLKKVLKPELLNRFDEIIVFARLKKKEQLRVLRLLINDIKMSLESQNIKIRVEREAENYILEKGYSQEYGARALRRTVEKELLDRVAEFLLKNKSRPLIITAIVGKKGIEILQKAR